MKLLSEYFALQQKIYDYFGYVEDWVKIPLDDCTCYYWSTNGDYVIFAENKQDVLGRTGFYENQAYKQRFLPKWVYRGAEYTMICCGTHTDGNKFLSVFDNSKEIKWEDLSGEH